MLGYFLQQVMAWRDGSAAPGASPFWCPLLLALVEVGGPLHVSIWEFSPSFIRVGAVGVDQDHPMAAQRKDVGGRCRWLWVFVLDVQMTGWIWDQDSMLVAQCLETCFGCRVPGVPACWTSGLWSMGSQVCDATEMQGVLAPGPVERGFGFVAGFDGAKANGACCVGGRRGNVFDAIVWCLEGEVNKSGMGVRHGDDLERKTHSKKSTNERNPQARESPVA